MENDRPANLYLLRRTYQLYGAFWKRHVFIALPPTLFSYLIYFLGGQLVTTLNRQLTRWDASHLSRLYFQITAATLAIRFLYFGLTWLLTTYAFAAVCNAVNETGSLKMQAIGDAYSAVREKLSGVISAGMISYVPAAVGFWVVLAGSLPIAFKLGSWRHFELIYWILSCAGMVALFSLLCRFGLSIPYLMDHGPPTPAREAIRASLRLSQGYEPYFAALVSKVIVVVFGGYWLGRYLIAILRQAYPIGYATSQWLTVAWDITLAVISEPFIFIGLTVLYLERTRAPQSTEANSTAVVATTAPAPISPQ